MNRAIRIFQVDAFTNRRFTGNPAKVVLDADSLSETDMLALARELGHGDTVFALAPRSAEHDVAVRFFNTRGETGFVGHATLALHAVLAELGRPACPRQGQRGGTVEVDRLEPCSPPRLFIHRPLPGPAQPLASGPLAALLEALGVEAGSLDEQCAPALSADGTRALVGLRRGQDLAALTPDFARLQRLAHGGPSGVFVYSRAPTLPDVFLESRMFCPALGFEEDPVSGNAHALVAAYFWQCGILGTERSSETIEWSGAQGHHQGRPGRVAVALHVEQGAPTGLSIGGEAVIAFECRLAE